MGEGAADSTDALVDQAADGAAVAGEEFDTVASASHRVQATTTVRGAVRTFCRVRASVGLSGQASVGARDGPPTPPRSPSPEAEPTPAPELPDAEPTPVPELPEAETKTAPELKPVTVSDAEMLAQLIGSPISDSLLQELLTMSAEDRMRLAEDLLRSLDPDDLLALLQKMRRFPWEIDCEAQTDCTGEIGIQSSQGDGGEGAASEQTSDQASLEAELEPEQPVRSKKLLKQEKRALNQFLKGANDKHAKPQGLKATRRTIAKVYEDKVMADEADDLDMRARDGFPTFLYDYMLKEFGIKSLAMQNLAKLVKSVATYANPEHEQYDERVHVFGKLSGTELS
jgi:hypothetical protein